MTDEELMERAISLAEESVRNGGGPFGAVIARGGTIIAEGANSVTSSCDPTAHAEVTAIRNAAATLGTYNLAGCAVYTSCEPCPMCLGAIYWARLDKVVYAADRTDAAAAGFDDEMIYREIALAPKERRLPSQRLLAAEAKRAFEMWTGKADKTMY